MARRCFAAHRHDILPVEADGAGGERDCRRDEAHHGAGGERLAGAGFADDADDLAGEDLEG